ncbi:MAG: hypothetical protein K1W34_15255 [Lachnospiraceae bacterium]
MKYYRLLEVWMQNLENGKKMEYYFQYNNYNQIALYGMGKMANHVIKELENSNIQIAYSIDRNPSISADIPILSIDEKIFPAVDAIIVTPIYDFPDIERKLSQIIDIPIIPLDEVVMETAVL